MDAPLSAMLDLMTLALLVLWPLPWWLGTRDRDVPSDDADTPLTVGFGWLLSQAVLALGLGAAGVYGTLWALLASAVLLALGVCCFSWRGHALPKATEGTPTVPVLVPPILSLIGLLVLTTLVFPTLDYDSLYYHLPAIATWHQAGAFDFPAQASLQQFYPYTWEAVCGLFFTVSFGDGPVFLPNVVAWGLFGLATYGVVRRLGGTTEQAASMGALAVALPLVVDQVNTMYVDLPLAACFMGALYFGLAFAQGGGARSLVICLATAALRCGRVSRPVHQS